MSEGTYTIREQLPVEDIALFARSTTPVMVRGIDGSITFWNQAAEKNYGFREVQALGNVSHLLLGTVFPQPLSEINAQLLRTGEWQGELIHTLHNGKKVKVWSHWVLNENEGKVIEKNINFRKLKPASAYLEKPTSFMTRFAHSIIEYRYWWLIPLVITLLILELYLELSPREIIVPLGL